MGPNHGRRRVLGRGVYALAACAAVAMAGFATGATAHGSLVGAAAPAPNARPAISANGRYVAFQSQATLKVSASVVPPPRATASPSGNWRVYVRDQTGRVTSLLSDPGNGDATAPSISGTGKLVSYLLDGGTENNVVVVNRQTTGKGPFDTAANLAVKTVTGTPNDL